MILPYSFFRVLKGICRQIDTDNEKMRKEKAAVLIFSFSGVISQPNNRNMILIFSLSEAALFLLFKKTRKNPHVQNYFGKNRPYIYK